MKCIPWLRSRKKRDVDGGALLDTPSASNSSENWKRKSNSDSYGLEGNQEARCLRFLEIARATKNFREANLIGEGDSGKVYKGRFANGQEIAVKRLNSDGTPANKEFIVEVLMLSLLHHPNLVKLIGYCAEGDYRLVVYEYMPKGSLADHLYEKSTVPVLDWNTRMKIAVGAAKGIEYLHCSADPPVIYRDLKSANILLDNEFNPRLSDFGIAKLVPEGDKTHVTTQVMGTYGYCAPDYAMTGKLTIKSDIFSFGVVLLELLTGRKAYDPSKKQEEQSLVAWSQPYIQNRTRSLEMVDARLEGRFPKREARRLICVISMLLMEAPKERPPISQIVVALEGLAAQPFSSSSTSNAARPPSASSSSRSGSQQRTNSAKPDARLEGNQEARCLRFLEIARATKDFREVNLIGEGESGKVYKGRFANGQEIAVKRLNSDGTLANKEFIVEVLMLCLSHHPNLVKLIGYCAEGDHRLLVYEYMPKGSLADHLYEKSTMPVLDWNTRMKIAVGAAKGLQYLHCFADPPVIYRDLKSANILLDNEFNPRLSDFGIAKLVPEGDKTHVTTQVMGTYGYCDPDYVMSGKLTIKSDIFSFGVVLLELLTGRKAYDFSKKQTIVAWSHPFIRDMTRSLEMVDARLKGRFPERDARRLIAVIALSINEAPDVRPSISEIVNVLEYLAARPPRASSSSASGSQQRTNSAKPDDNE